MSRSPLLALASLTLALPAPTPALTWQILPDGTGDAPTIQAGVDSAAAGDVVELAAGTYTGPGNRGVTFHGLPITVRSASGDPATCIIDCEAQDRGFFLGGTDDDVVLEGMTVTNGFTFFGGGLYADADCIVRSCVFTSGTGGEGGGAYFGGEATVEECSFVDNTAQAGGGFLVTTVGGSATFTGCRITGNVATELGGGVIVADGNLELQDCVVAGNTAQNGGGIGVVSFAYVQATGCTVTGNAATDGALAGGGVYVDTDENTVSISHCIISFSEQGRGVYSDNASVTVLGCTNIYGNADADWTPDLGSPGVNGNFTGDPLFCDVDGGDFTLQSDSPCAPPGVTGCGLVGALPVACGPVAVDVMSWGKVKGSFR